ncbi:Hypp4012 [Branchiostoma lanceolatum]|uniref:Hypp4012 protein n=1 Tax=Branchiostoma lanceolatum TaxID=7740 RepID=A0A8K0A7I8_BRALA|nr:Hypp4012 [Branchiostoma lanceolatum]
MRLATGELLLYSGHTEKGAIHSEGVALMLAREAQRALIGWEPVNPRIITAKFATKKSNINLRVIQCYAPTNDAEEEKKEEFHQQLQAVLDKGRNKDITLLMGDLNAKIGSDITGHEGVMGTHGLGRMNENAEGFTDLCSLNQLVIGGSIFMHKRIHKATWRSPDHITENQIDHMCISQKFRRLWSDVRVMRGADVSSDHHLLVTSARLRLKKHPTTTNPRKRYNVGLLKDKDIQKSFKLSLSNKFEPLQELFKEEDTGIEDQWQQVKKGWLDTCEEVLGKKKTHEKEWISFSTLRKLDTRKQKKAVLNASRTRSEKVKAPKAYTAVEKEVKKSIKRDKRDHIEDLAKQAEEAAGKGNLKDLYIRTRKLAGKFPQVDKPVRDKEGNLLTTTEEQLKRWAEHFSDLLNRLVPEIPPNIPHAEEELPINTGKPSKIEIKKAIMSLRNGKSAGPDDIPAEALKADLGN